KNSLHFFSPTPASCEGAPGAAGAADVGVSPPALSVRPKPAGTSRFGSRGAAWFNDGTQPSSSTLTHANKHKPVALDMLRKLLVTSESSSMHDMRCRLLGERLLVRRERTALPLFAEGRVRLVAEEL